MKSYINISPSTNTPYCKPTDTLGGHSANVNETLNIWVVNVLVVRGFSLQLERPPGQACTFQVAEDSDRLDWTAATDSITFLWGLAATPQLDKHLQNKEDIILYL